MKYIRMLFGSFNQANNKTETAESKRIASLLTDFPWLWAIFGTGHRMTPDVGQGIQVSENMSDLMVCLSQLSSETTFELFVLSFKVQCGYAPRYEFNMNLMPVPREPNVKWVEAVMGQAVAMDKIGHVVKVNRQPLKVDIFRHPDKVNLDQEVSHINNITGSRGKWGEAYLGEEEVP